MGRAKDHEQQMLLSDFCAAEKQHREGKENGPQNRNKNMVLYIKHALLG